jgi:hypothetical protein
MQLTVAYRWVLKLIHIIFLTELLHQNTESLLINNNKRKTHFIPTKVI